MLSAQIIQLNTDCTSSDEQRRIAAVRRYDILDTPPDGAFDRITAVAAKLFGVPIAIVSIVDEDRIWFKSHHGLDVRQIDRSPGLCSSAIMQVEPYILTDAKTDARSLANPLVAGEFGLRFYVGVPLRTHDGHNLGTLCVIDREARSVTDDQISYLTDLATIIIDQMELRLSARNAIAQKELLAQEIEHRVKNSLSLIAGLLRLQSKTSEPKAAKELATAAARVGTIAEVHHHIHLSGSVENVEFRGYLTSLCGSLSAASGMTERAIIVESIETLLSTKKIVSLGLIVNELVTNAAKHGAGDIRVSLEKSSTHKFTLRISDEGPGLPNNFEPQQSKGLGMKVVNSLVKQLEAELVFGNAPGLKGAEFAVMFS